MKSGAQLRSVAGSRTWDKELLIWIGAETALREAIASAEPVMLDLLDLFDLDNLPADDAATRDQLRENLRDHLRTIPRGPEQRVILIVKSIGLLARYNVGLDVFYNWFIGDFAMAILLLDGGIEKTEWPEEVQCESNRLLGYFSEPGMVKDIFGTSG